MPISNVAQPTLTTLAPVTTAVVRGTVPTSDLRDFFDRSFQVLGEVLAAQGANATGPAFGLYRGPIEESTTLEVGFPTDCSISPDGSAEAGELPGGRVAQLVHRGGYEGLGDSWQRLRTWIVEQNLTPGDTYWEVYLTEASPDMDPADLRTELNWSIS
jgi:effector-binding domain-containing protein